MVVAITKVKLKVARGCRLGAGKVMVIQVHLVEGGGCHGNVWHHITENTIAASTRLLL